MTWSLTSCLCLLLSLSLAVHLSYSSPPSPFPCHFSSQFSTQSILSSASEREAYMETVAQWEGRFHSPGVGYDADTGLTFDGHGIDDISGDLAPPLHYWTAASKEAVHLMLLAKSLAGNRLVQIFVDPSLKSSFNQSLSLLEKKAVSYENFNKQYPGYGGFLPWIYVNKTGVFPADGWWDRVPSLDNGEWMWGVYAVKETLKDLSTDFARELPTECLHCYERILHSAAAYATIWTRFVKNAKLVFYDGNGMVNDVSQIDSIYTQPSPGMYHHISGYLDDPYEGEMFTVFIDLFSSWETPEEREQLWIQKRAKLQSVDYITKENVAITVQKGYWFSSHEQWKYLELPYFEVEINRRVFLNGEKVRTIHSKENNIPGMFASVANYTISGPVTQYLSACGIPSISFQPVATNIPITPYSSFPTILATSSAVARGGKVESDGVGIAWHLNMISLSRMQGPYGTTEACSITGDYIAPVLTWDSKITTVAAMVGGISDIVSKGLKREAKFARFHWVIEREWSRVFPSLKGETSVFAPPGTGGSKGQILSSCKN